MISLLLEKLVISCHITEEKNRFLKRGEKKRVCSHKSKLFRLKVEHILEGLRHPNKQTGISH